MDESGDLKQGVELAKKGDCEQASIFLAKAVKENPSSEEAWLWLGRCRSVPSEKRYCFYRVLEINPANKEVQRELNRRPGKTWVRRSIFLLFGILLGIISGVGIVNFILPSSFFQNIATTIALKTYHEPSPQSIPNGSGIQQGSATATSPALTAEERLTNAWPLIAQASAMMKQKQFGDAILLWNQALEMAPEYTEGYFERGAAYYNLTGSQRSKSEFDSYLNLAIQDFDKAISMDPNSVADYYQMRGLAYTLLAPQQPLRVDYQHLERIAMENILHSEQLPIRETWPAEKANLFYTMIGAGNCQQVIPKASQLLSTETNPDAQLHNILASAYYCTGDLENSLLEVNTAYKLIPSGVCLCERARVLYGLGRRDEAMADIEASLSESPYYKGDRYYFRALLYAELGNLDQAQKDLDFGITQTWGRGGLLPYVEGKIALAKGDKEQAVNYYQEAEATYLDEGPMLEQIRNDLRAIGGAPYPTNIPLIDVTPIPDDSVKSTPQPIFTIFPTSTPQPIITIFPTSTSSSLHTGLP